MSALSRDRANVIDREHVGRVSHRHDELAVLIADGDCSVPSRHGTRDTCQGRAIDLEVGEVDEAHPDLRGQRGHELGLGEDTLVDQHAAEAATQTLLLSDRGVELVTGDQSSVEEDLAELLHGGPLGCHRPRTVQERLR